MLIQKRVLKEHFFDENFIYAEDLEIISRIKKHHKWVFVPEMLVHYSSRETFWAYAIQMYKYGLWKIYYGFTANDYRFVDFVPLTIMVLSGFVSLLLGTWIPLLSLVGFSLIESLFVIFVAGSRLVTALLFFPVWIVKNHAWSLGIVTGILSLCLNKKLRARLVQKSKWQ